MTKTQLVEEMIVLYMDVKESAILGSEDKIQMLVDLLRHIEQDKTNIPAEVEFNVDDEFSWFYSAVKNDPVLDEAFRLRIQLEILRHIAYMNQMHN